MPETSRFFPTMAISELYLTAKSTTTWKYETSWKYSDIASSHIATRKLFFAPSCSGTRNAFRNCGECLRSHYEKNPRHARFCHATAWHSNRFTSCGTAQTCLLAPREEPFVSLR